MTIRCTVLLATLLVAPVAANSQLQESEPEIDPRGRPQGFVQGKAVLCGIWYEDGYWILRTTTNSQDGNRQFDTRHVFTGKVRIKGGRVVKYLDLDTLETHVGKIADRDVLLPRSGGFDFRFVNFGLVDSVKFKLSDKSQEITFEITIDGDDDPNKILIGKSGTHPDKTKFSLPAIPNK